MSPSETMANYEGKFKMKLETSDKKRIACFPAQNRKTHDKRLIQIYLQEKQKNVH